MENQQTTEGMFKALADALARSGYKNFFPTLVQQLAEMLRVEHVLIADTSTDPIKATTLAVWSDGQHLENFSYTLQGTPCETVPDTEPCLYNANVAKDFPDDALLEHMGVESYLGMPALTQQGKKLGIVTIMANAPIKNTELAREVLRIAAAQVGAELDRIYNQKHIKKLAYDDGVTRLPNRHHLMRTLDRVVSFADKGNTGIALAIVDLNRFKDINDTHGPEVGDQVLEAMARRLEGAADRECYIARYSGDEFVVIAPKGDGEYLDNCKSELLHSFQRPLVCAGREFHVSICIGATLVEQSSGTLVPEPLELLRQASIALAEAKREGKLFQLFDEAMTRMLYQRQETYERFVKALRANKLELHYQPQFDLVTGELSGAEALCRWHDDEWGWVSPVEFIPLVEERGLMTELGEWVFSTACKQIKAWANQHKHLPGTLCVNVSAQQFENPNLCKRLLELSEGVSAEKIGFELTESVLMSFPDQALNSMSELTRAGFTLAIDDFGTGYSSLSYLTRFDAQVLKIDRSFIMHLPSSGHHHTIIRTIIAMANSLNMTTIAEGIETQDQADVLQVLGCLQGQGFHLGRPVPADIFAKNWL